MRRLTRRAFLAGLSTSAAYAWVRPGSSAATATEKPQPPSEHLLWYNEAATSWDTGLPVGNGRLGGMVFAAQDSLRILLNEESFWSGEPRNYHPQDGSPYLDMLLRLLTNENGPRADQVVSERLLSKTSESYQPLGGLTISFGGSKAGSDFRRSLDLRNAIHVSSVKRRTRSFETGWFATETFASEPDDVLVLHIRAEEDRLSLTATLSSPQHGGARSVDNTLLLEIRAPAHAIPSDVPNANGAVTWDKGGSGKGMRATIALTVLEHGGGQVSVRDGLHVEGAEFVTLLLAARTSYAGPDRSPSLDGNNATALVLRDLRRATMAGTSVALRARHVAAHRVLFDRVQLQLHDEEGRTPRDLSSLPTDERLYAVSTGHADPGLASLLFHYGRYLLLASSRKGSLPATAQGIWTHRVRQPVDAGWNLSGSLPATYWLAEIAALPECLEPVFALARRLQADGVQTAMRVYGVHGWVAHTNVDLWGSTLPGIDESAAAIWKCGAAWLSLMIWDAFQFSRDLAFLRENYSIMLGASRFFLEHMRNDREGWLAAYPESSLNRKYRLPNGDAAYSSFSPTMNTAIVRELLTATSVAADVLGEDSGMQERLLAAARQMQPLSISQHTGELLEWPEPSWIAQDVVSLAVPQIWPLMPGTQITPENTPEFAAAAHRTLQNRSSWRVQPGSEVAAHTANAYARLRDGESAYRILNAHLMRGVQPNLMANDQTTEHSGETIVAATFSMCAAMSQMLVQSTSEEISLLPALPSAWSSGNVRGLRAHGGWTVDVAWQHGKATSAVLRATQDGMVTVKAPARQRVARVSSALSLTRPAKDNARWQACKGTTYRLAFL